MSWFLAQLCWGGNWGKGWCWRVTASESQSSVHPALLTTCWALILSGLSSLSLNGPAKPLAEEEATLAGSSEPLHQLEPL